MTVKDDFIADAWYLRSLTAVVVGVALSRRASLSGFGVENAFVRLDSQFLALKTCIMVSAERKIDAVIGCG